jgi:glutamate-1-semialdehyde 2,1-aminomutase
MGPVYQAGTLSGNPLSVRAGIETLKLLQEPRAYARLEAAGQRLAAGLSDCVSQVGMTGCVNRAGSLMTLFMGVEKVGDVAEAQRSDSVKFKQFFHAMLARGIYLPPSQFEAMFISLAHSDEDIDATIAAARDSIAEIGRR